MHSVLLVAGGAVAGSLATGAAMIIYRGKIAAHFTAILTRLQNIENAVKGR